MNYSKLFKERYFSQAIVLLLLLLLLAIGAVPGYLKGHWQWQKPQAIANLKELKQIRQTGITLPGWQTTEQAEQQIGEHKWSLQLLKKQDSQTEAVLLLLPQSGPRTQPQVEWTEINGWGRARWGRWDIAQNRSVEFTVKRSQVKELTAETTVKAMFFRAATREQTFAVLQWYAWRNGGNPSPLQWLLVDQIAQWHNQRVAWVAVSILVPMEPLGQIETIWPEIGSLGETVQAVLTASIL
ncbi:cyanoexosortase B system-associated protein [Fischerella sp. PCC 9605]|uniref:cyanoexosortase B system-associated protein n=1 Tax=Fischerella sp. PCC 9605 TaxID=1173024 RepID=UPI00047AD7E4|nr:cyanoexosortase B system-associated protein [Fischerella sp. PCC 9605]